ncbi:MAG: YihY/virulence factor BrkB family protein [Anaerolineaceae bacterium]|nr:YihY/virulence factor BrkB family protein [Anaerolineaceae bacterium]
MTHQSVSSRLISRYWLKIRDGIAGFWNKLKEQNKIFFQLIQETGREYTLDQGPLMSAAMVYYAVLSMAPLILLFLSTIGFVLRFNANGSIQDIYILIEEQFGPQLRNAIDNLLSTVKNQAITVSGIGLVALLLGGSSAFRFLSYTFRRIWRPTPRPASFRVAVSSLLRDHAAGVILLLAVVGLLFISMLFLTFIQIVQSVFFNIPGLQTLKGIELQPLASILIGTIVLIFVYRYMPPTRLHWRDVWLGALLAALLWEGASMLLKLYFDIRTSLIYGIIGSILVITIWVFIMCQILFIGAEFCKVHSKWRKSVTRQNRIKQKQTGLT